MVRKWLFLPTSPHTLVSAEGIYLFLVIGTLQLLPQKCVCAAYLIDLYLKSCSKYFVNGLLREVKLPKVVVIGFSAVLNNHKHDRFN